MDAEQHAFTLQWCERNGVVKVLCAVAVNGENQLRTQVFSARARILRNARAQ